MQNFKIMLSEALAEQNKTFADLEKADVICKRAFYQYGEYTPYLPTIIKIANYLKISLDYLTGRTNENIFRPYKQDQTNFYKNLTALLKSYSVTQSKFADELKIARPNFHHWRNGKLPKLSTLVSIAAYLNCSIDDLLDTE